MDARDAVFFAGVGLGVIIESETDNQRHVDDVLSWWRPLDDMEQAMTLAKRYQMLIDFGDYSVRNINRQWYKAPTNDDAGLRMAIVLCAAHTHLRDRND